MQKELPVPLAPLQAKGSKTVKSYNGLGDVFNVRAPGFNASFSPNVNPSITAGPPRVPPKPPIIRKKLIRVARGTEEKQVAHLGRRVRVTFQDDLPTVERVETLESGTKLAPKPQNPSLPNLDKLRLLAESDSDDDQGSMPSRQSLNPFRRHYSSSEDETNGGYSYDRKVANTFSVNSGGERDSHTKKSPFRLGEEFFASLFAERMHQLQVPTFTNANDLRANKRLTRPNSPSLPPPSADPVAAQWPQQEAPKPPADLLAAAKSGGAPPPAAAAAAAPAVAPKAAAASGSGQKPQDRYAALKDLDEIFKSSVAVNEGGSRLNTIA